MTDQPAYNLKPDHLPAPLRGLEPGSFAEHTMTTRLPGIARRVLENGDWPPEIRRDLAALAGEMPHGILRRLRGERAPDLARWESWMQPFLGRTWLEAPWFPAEVYFFRRVLEATRYYETGPGRGVDPFRTEKTEGTQDVLDQLQPVCASLDSASPADRKDTLEHLLQTVVWGNQADLSVWPSGGGGPANHEGEQRQSHLLADHSDSAAALLLFGQSLGRVDFILDNVGLELAYDLLLADFLLDRDLAQRVRFHAKPHPTYVSDATIPDVWELIERLAGSGDPGLGALGRRLRLFTANERLQLASHYYWISPLAGWEMPGDLYRELGEAGLLISKGDANYRRWLNDLQWLYEAPIERLLAYRPAPLLLLRVLKSEIVAGLPAGRSGELFEQDPTWLFNGSWAVIQIV